MENIQDTSSGKMFPEHSRQTRARTSGRSLPKSAKSKKNVCLYLNLQNGKMQDASWEKASVSHGDSSMLSIGVFPREDNVSTLSQILMEGVPEKYYLSPRACQGILQQGFKSWQDSANGITESIRKTGGYSVDGYNSTMDDVAATLGINCGMSTGRNGVMVEKNAFLFENHSQDTRYRGPLSVAQTVSSTYGTGGNNQPFVVQTPKTLKIRSGCEGGGKGALIQEDLSATLGTNNDQTLFQPRAFGVCAKNSNSMKSDNPDSGFYEADTARTLDASGGNPTCNQGGIAVIEGNGSRPSHKGDGYKESEVMYTLNATEHHAVAFADVHATLSANDGPKGPIPVR